MTLYLFSLAATSFAHFRQASANITVVDYTAMSEYHHLVAPCGTEGLEGMPMQDGPEGGEGPDAIPGEARRLSSSLHFDLLPFSAVKQRCPHMLQDTILASESKDSKDTADTKHTGVKRKKSTAKSKPGIVEKKEPARNVNVFDGGLPEDAAFWSTMSDRDQMDMLGAFGDDDGAMALAAVVAGAEGASTVGDAPKMDRKSTQSAIKFYKSAEDIHAVPSGHEWWERLFSDFPVQQHQQMGTGSDKLRNVYHLKDQVVQETFTSLPVFDPDHESTLLYACGPRCVDVAGERKTITVPGCCKEDRCIGLSGEIQKASDTFFPSDHPFCTQRGWQLCALMTPKEWNHLKQTGQAPAGPPRRCIMDERRAIQSIIVATSKNSDRMKIRWSTQSKIQVYRNPIRGPGPLYKEEYVYQPHTGKQFCGLTDPIVQCNLDPELVFWQYDAQQKQPFINQNALRVSTGTAASQETKNGQGAV